MSTKNITVAGAGLVGSLLSIFLARRGYKVNVFERRPDLRSIKVAPGRSINLAMSERGWTALKKVDLEDEIRGVGIAMPGRMIHLENGEKVYQPYGKDGEAIFSVSRNGLNRKLLEIASREPNITFHFNQKCIDVDLKNAALHVENNVTNQRNTIEADLLFGTDGAFSMVRQAMQKTDLFNYSQNFLEHGYKELSIPAAADGSAQLDLNALHIWPRNSYMMIALPNTDNTFTCTLFIPFKGEISFEKLTTTEEWDQFIKTAFPSAYSLIPDLAMQTEQNPVSSLVTIQCSPWNFGNKVCLLGDASHAIVPFFGQGMNSGFEDCTLLDSFIENSDKDISDLMELFSQNRIPDANAIAAMAYENFIEMRDKVADPQFLLRKKIEKWIAETYPENYLPKYSMVSFSNVPYREALEAGKKQDKLFEQLLSIPNIENDFQVGESKMVIEEFLGII